MTEHHAAVRPKLPADPTGRKDRDDEAKSNEAGTGLDDGAEPTYEDGSPMDPSPEPEPVKPDHK